MREKNSLLARRVLMMLVGILFISICVGCYRMSGFGVDAFTRMNLGISVFFSAGCFRMSGRSSVWALSATPLSTVR